MSSRKKSFCKDLLPESQGNDQGDDDEVTNSKCGTKSKGPRTALGVEKTQVKAR